MRHGVRRYSGSSGSTPTGLPSCDSRIFSTLASAAPSNFWQWSRSRSPRSYCVIDSSSATLPCSSRSTIFSSSASAALEAHGRRLRCCCRFRTLLRPCCFSLSSGGLHAPLPIPQGLASRIRPPARSTRRSPQWRPQVPSTAGRPVEILPASIAGPRAGRANGHRSRPDMSDEVRAEAVYRRKDAAEEGFAELLPAIAFAQRRVEDVACSRFRTSAPVPGYSGIWCVEAKSTDLSSQKMSCVPLPWCTSKSTIATRFDAMRLLRVPCGDGDGVDEAKSHRIGFFGVVPRRAHGAERIRKLARKHPVDGGDRGSDRTLHRFPAFRAGGGVLVDPRTRPVCGMRLSIRWMWLRGWARVNCSGSASGASWRSRKWNRSSDSASSTARSRSGRSGWPGGIRCSRQIG